MCNSANDAKGSLFTSATLLDVTKLDEVCYDVISQELQVSGITFSDLYISKNLSRGLKPLTEINDNDTIYCILKAHPFEHYGSTLGGYAFSCIDSIAFD